MDTKEFGKELKRIRKGKRLTLEQLGKRTDFTKGYISMIENGKLNSIPQPDTLWKLAYGLGVDYNYLMKKAGHVKDTDSTIPGIPDSFIEEVNNAIQSGGPIPTLVNGFYQTTEDEGLRFRSLDFPVNDIHFHLTDKNNGKSYKNIPLTDKDRKMMAALFEAYLIERLSEYPEDNAKELEALKDENHSNPPYIGLRKGDD